MADQTPEEAAQEFFDALNKALDDHELHTNVDPDDLTQLTTALAEQGYTITDGVVFTHPTDGRWFVLVEGGA